MDDNFDPDAFLAKKEADRQLQQQQQQATAQNQPDNDHYYRDLGISAVADLAKPAMDVAHFAVSHPVESSLAASYVPGLNQLPGIKDIAAARQALYNKYIGPQQTFDALKTPPTPTAPEAPPTGQNFIQRMASQFGDMATKVRPVVQNMASNAVEGAQNLGRAALEVAPNALRVGGVGLAAMTPTSLNTGEQQELQQRQQQLNPAQARAILESRNNDMIKSYGQQRLQQLAGMEIMPHRNKSGTPEEAAARSAGEGKWTNPGSGNTHIIETLPNGIHRETTHDARGNVKSVEHWRS